jgi:beta-lactamase superfamily II metal-dependent hydrolase
VKSSLRVVFVFLLWSLPLSAQQLRIYNIDVEQASATLFVAPGGKTLLVDSGKNGMGGRIKAVMDRAGVSAIDYFVLTHYHEDHDGGIDDLVHLGVPIRQAYDRGDKNLLPTSQRNQATFKNYQGAVGEDAQQLRSGMTVPLDPLMTVTCISSGGVVIGESVWDSRGHDENDMSISLLVTFGPFRYFIGGDIEAPTCAEAWPITTRP